jgi:short-subunit dehydrogenase
MAVIAEEAHELGVLTMHRYLITGASRGIGRAIAIRLAAPDRELLLHGRDREALVEVYTEVEAAGGKAIILTADLSDPTDIERLVAKIGPNPLYVLINNAGIAVVKPFEAHTLRDWQHTLAVNVIAPILLTQKLLPLMGRGSSIVNIVSIAAKTAFPGWSSYCMSKFALDGFAKSIREELRPRGIRVINVYPSATATEIWDGVEGDWPRDTMMSPDEVAEAVAYALSRPDSVLVEDITVTSTAGNL